jgi:glycogen operon protein
VRTGSHLPRGAHWDGHGVNFSLFSAHATRVQLCLFDAGGTQEVQQIDLPEYTDEMWHGYVEGLGPGTIYGYRVHGPYEPEAGHRFNPHKLLLDPFARAHVGSLQWDDACFGYTIGAAGDDLSFDTRDSAPFVPKSVVIDPSFEWRTESSRRPVPWDDTIVYELHVRGYTKRHPGVPEPLRGTFAGLSQPAVIDYIRGLGVTSVELLPVHLFVRDRHLVERGLVNFWGYNSLGFFAPDAGYMADPANGLREFKEMVARLHDAGLEVILDVVYNHTGEGSELGPTLSFRGIDNASYYRLIQDRPRYYHNDTGTGNALNLRHPRVTQMVIDGLRYWVTDMHVDGFRFDLGTTLARREDTFDEYSGFLTACLQDPVISAAKLIAEPWDCGPDGYQVGRFPPGWVEWNDRFRDDVRSFWCGGAPVGTIAARLCGSADIFDRRGRKPWASLNFVTAHDGFTMLDLVSYNEKHNEANGDGNCDGTDDNRSNNHGAEGPTDAATIVGLRQQQVRNLLSTLLLSQGTPMILAGDECGRTQLGNNNAYCQDNEISWMDWERAAGYEPLVAFLRRLTMLRHRHPLLRQTRFLHGALREEAGFKDVTWINRAGREMTQEEWDSSTRVIGMRLEPVAAEGREAAAPEPPLLLLFNGGTESVRWMLPGRDAGHAWSVVLDTTKPDRATGRVRRWHETAPRSVVVLEATTPAQRLLSSSA